MNFPQPANLNALKNVLSKAKNVMNTVESGNFEKGNIDSRALNEDTIGDLIDKPNRQSKLNNTPTSEQIKNSKLPSNIKNMMLESPLPPAPPLPTLDLGGDEYYNENDEKPFNVIQENQKRNVNKVNNRGGNNIDNDTLKETIKDVLIEYLSNEYTKKITENVIKQTINTLIKEGKLGKRTI